MQTLDEILTQFHDLNRRNLFNKIKMCQLVHIAKTEYGLDYNDFAKRTGVSAQSVREYGYLYRFYLPVMEELLQEIETNQTLLYKTLIHAKSGLGVHDGYSPEEGAQRALQRIRDWHGMSEDQTAQLISGQPFDVTIVKEFIGTKYEIVQFAKRMAETELGDGQYRFVIHKVK